MASFSESKSNCTIKRKRSHVRNSKLGATYSHPIGVLSHGLIYRPQVFEYTRANTILDCKQATHTHVS